MNTKSIRTRFSLVTCTVRLQPLAAAGVLAVGILLAGCRSAKVTSEQHFGSPSRQPVSIVYVADFELGAKGVQSEKGVLSEIPVVGGGADKVLYGQKSPAVRARELTELMSRSLIKDIERAGYTAMRLAPGDPTPTNGWLVRGVFTEVQQGNRLRRAMIGFGLGKTDLQVLTKFDELSAGTPKPFYELNTDASSGRLPGAAPMLIISPYAAPARFVLAGRDLDRSVRRTASSISKALEKEMRESHP